MERWNKLALSPPAGLASAGQAITSLLSEVRGALEIARTAIALSDVLGAGPPATNILAFNTAMNLLIDSIEAALDAGVEDLGAYVLVIPPPKRSILDPRLDDEIAGEDAGKATLWPPLARLFKSMPAERRDRIYQSLDVSSLFENNAYNPGGNSHLIKTLIDSVSDRGDEHRPRWTTQGMHWGYMAIVGGSSDISKVLPLLFFCHRLFRGVVAAVSQPQDVVSLVPTRLSSRISYDRNASTPHVILEWEGISSQRLLQSLENRIQVVEKYAVIRSTDSRLLDARLVTDLFPSGQLTEGATGLFGSKVLKVTNYDGLTNRSIDAGPFEEGKEYFYTVAFHTSLRGFLVEPQILGYRLLSPTTTVYYAAREPIPSVRSIAPDWYRTPSLGSLIPDVGDFIYSVKEKLDTFRLATNTSTERLSGTLTFLQRVIDQYAGETEELVGQLNRLVQLFTLPADLAGVYLRFGTGDGDVSAFVADVVESLSDSSDTSRPQFDDGSEYTTGTIVLYAHPNAEVIATAISALSLLFGGSNSNPISDVLRDIDTSLTTETEHVFEELREQIRTATQASTYVPPVCEPAVAAPTIQLDDNFKVIE